MDSFRLYGHCCQKHTADGSIALGHSWVNAHLPCTVQLQSVVLDRLGKRSLVGCRPRAQRAQAAGWSSHVAMSCLLLQHKEVQAAAAPMRHQQAAGSGRPYRLDARGASDPECVPVT